MSGRKICVVSGSRADYGLLAPVMRLIRDDPNLDLQVIVTGMHLSADFGFTYRRLEHDGFAIDARVESLQRGDDVGAVTRSIGYGVIGFADTLQRLRPDLMMILGDRYEILAAAQAALIARVPVAHLCGGDSTEGAFDEGIRHAITKMAHLHFVTNGAAARRLRQMGENPEHIYEVGSPGLDQLKQVKLLPRDETFKALGIEPRDRNLLITFHPETLASESAIEQLDELLAALDELGPDYGLIFTGPNADTEGRALAKRIETFVAGHGNAILRTSLGQKLYLSALAQAHAVVGNSSSGLYEAPSLKVPTVNIGDRQKGRVTARSVVDCPAGRAEIQRAIIRALALDCSLVQNPYGDGNSAPRIVEALKAVANPAGLLKKHFYELEVA
jgi:UDP-N-acetylglucosamine 2-epimerase (non-hydrolysing)/GDP/UDP-N,N'-diacetylbacillosamine 2-epimerase (hydrolysing)